MTTPRVNLTPVTHQLDRLVSAVRKNTEARNRHADEQHTRNRLAAITARSRGLALPPDLVELAEEGF